MQPGTFAHSPTSGGWERRSFFLQTSYNCIHVGASDKREVAIEVGGKVWGGSVVTEEVYNPWRFRLCVGSEGTSYVFRAQLGTEEDEEVPDYSQLYPRVPQDTQLYPRTRVQDQFLKNGHHRDAICLEVRFRSLSTGTQTLRLSASCLTPDTFHEAGVRRRNDCLHSFRWEALYANT